MMMRLDNLEMLLILEEEKSKEKKMKRVLFPTNTLQLLYPPSNPTIFPIKII